MSASLCWALLSLLLKWTQTVTHLVPLYSLENAFNPKELRTRNQRWRKLTGEEDAVDYVCELKIDGSAIALSYEEGLLLRGATRGDGSQG